MFGACVRRATYKKELSYVDQIKSFDDNISVTSSLSYLQDLLYMGIVAIAYQEPVTVKVNRSFVLLPETPEMMPRMADPRMLTMLSLKNGKRVFMKGCWYGIKLLNVLALRM